jgi:hypothetical protein
MASKQDLERHTHASHQVLKVVLDIWSIIHKFLPLFQCFDNFRRLYMVEYVHGESGWGRGHGMASHQDWETQTCNPPNAQAGTGHLGHSQQLLAVAPMLRRFYAILFSYCAPLFIGCVFSTERVVLIKHQFGMVVGEHNVCWIITPHYVLLCE